MQPPAPTPRQICVVGAHGPATVGHAGSAAERARRHPRAPHPSPVPASASERPPVLSSCSRSRSYATSTTPPPVKASHAAHGFVRPCIKRGCRRRSTSESCENPYTPTKNVSPPAPTPSLDSIASSCGVIPRSTSPGDNTMRRFVAFVAITLTVGLGAFVSITPTTAEACQADGCCRHCTNSQPCGNSCIPWGKQCHQPPGCAC